MRKLVFVLLGCCFVFSVPAGSAPAATITLDGTSGNNTIGTGFSTDGGANVSLGFFVDTLAVGGGGSGGTADRDDDTGGGGGAGGLIFKPGNQVSAITSVTVGAGGVGTSYGHNDGQNSIFGNLNAIGGGGGGADNNDFGSGGSGGGASGDQNGMSGNGNNNAVGSGLQPSQSGDSGTYGHGNDGGTGYWNDGGWSKAGGGGGAGGAARGRHDGGHGLYQVTVGGTTYNFADVYGSYGHLVGGERYFAGGGGGGSGYARPDLGGAGGNGGGGAGGDGAGKNAASNHGEDATANTGGGGGGAARGDGDGDRKTVSGAGGSGIVLVRYAGAAVAAAGGTYSTVNGQNVHAFTGGSSAFNLSGVDMNARLGATVTGTITGSGGLTYNGPGLLTLAADNTYTGGTTINAGTLQIGSGGTTGALGSGGVVNDSLLIFNRSDDITLGDDISGTGILTQAGSGALILTGNNTYTGNTDVNAGMLLVGGTHTGGGAYTVQSDAAFGGSGSIDSALTLNAGANFWWDGLSTLTVLDGNAVALHDSFGIDSLVGFDWADIGMGTYTLIENDSDFANISNWGSANAYTLGDGRSAYFSQGSLQLTVTPEPGTWLLLLSALACGLLVRRRGR